MRAAIAAGHDDRMMPPPLRDGLALQVVLTLEAADHGVDADIGGLLAEDRARRVAVDVGADGAAQVPLPVAGKWSLQLRAAPTTRIHEAVGLGDPVGLRTDGAGDLRPVTLRVTEDEYRAARRPR